MTNSTMDIVMCSLMIPFLILGYIAILLGLSFIVKELYDIITERRR